MTQSCCFHVVFNIHCFLRIDREFDDVLSPQLFWQVSKTTLLLILHNIISACVQLNCAYLCRVDVRREDVAHPVGFPHVPPVYEEGQLVAALVVNPPKVLPV